MSEKNILCFGDSNTWGADPAWGPRFDRQTRWPCILQGELGAGYHIVEEGLGGRTTVFDDPLEGDKSGLAQLTPILQSHKPLDLLVIKLGTNDLKSRFSASAMDISWGIRRLIQRARANADAFVNGTVNILVICPAPLADMSEMDFEPIFIGGEAKSHQLAKNYQKICDELNVPMLNAGDIIQSSPTDGIHLDASEHSKLGKAVAELVKNLVDSASA
ncbi:MAG: SGNH/GDSL hydrolase family protein [Opitutaceae bacterium]